MATIFRFREGKRRKGSRGKRLAAPEEGSLLYKKGGKKAQPEREKKKGKAIQKNSVKSRFEKKNVSSFTGSKKNNPGEKKKEVSSKTGEGLGGKKCTLPGQDGCPVPGEGG